MPLPPVSRQDLDHILDRTRPLWEELRGQRIFITGGTGFFGAWLLESLVGANSRLGLGVRAVVLSRNPERFRQKLPHLFSGNVLQTLQGDIRDFALPEGSFSHVIHAATDADTKLIREQPQLTSQTIVDGTQRMIEFAKQAGVAKFLLTSSGAVYGTQPSQLTHLPEDHPFTVEPSHPIAPYAEGKRLAEEAIAQTPFGKIARCFAFVGPHLPLDGTYAAGNFIRDALQGNPIAVGGDGTALRSYLYATDLAIWLWTLLFKAPAGRPYNVGSDQTVSIAELANRIAQKRGLEVRIAKKPEPGAVPARYVPSIQRAREELGLDAWVELDSAIERTLAWSARGASNV